MLCAIEWRAEQNVPKIQLVVEEASKLSGGRRYRHGKTSGDRDTKTLQNGSRATTINRGPVIRFWELIAGNRSGRSWSSRGTPGTGISRSTRARVYGQRRDSNRTQNNDLPSFTVITALDFCQWTEFKWARGLQSQTLRVDKNTFGALKLKSETIPLSRFKIRILFVFQECLVLGSYFLFSKYHTGYNSYRTASYHDVVGVFFNIFLYCHYNIWIGTTIYCFIIVTDNQFG